MSASFDSPEAAADIDAVLLQSAPLRVPRHVIRAVVVSAIATILIGIPALVGNPLYTENEVLIILGAHFVVLFFPVAHILGAFERRRDFFHPVFLAGLTFLLFQIVMNPLVYSEELVLEARRLTISSDALRTQTILHSYLVLLISWWAYVAGQYLLATRQPIRTIIPRKETRLFLLIALVFVIIGVIGNIGILGGLGTYLSKMATPWERWSEYEEGSLEGGTKWTIFMRFLPVGLVVLAYGIYLWYKLKPAAFYALIVGASVANMFLSCASGGRGTMLSTAFYGVVLVNHSIKRFSLKALASTFVVLLALAYVLGQIRGAAYVGKAEVTYVDNTALVQFGTIYLSNYLGTLALVAFVEQEGTFHGGTAFAGLTGLLGGPTPLTTEKEVWYRVSGKYLTENPRYGAPGELYFNFGWTGVLIGMCLLGVLVKGLAGAYDRAAADISLGGGLLAVFAAFTANFVMIANLDYLPPYFTYLSAPFYIVFWVYRKRRT